MAGAPFPPTLYVEFRDAFGNRDASLSDSVTMSIESGPVGGALLPTSVLTQMIANGGGPASGQFAGLEAQVAGTYVLRATTKGGLTGLSQPLVVVPNGSLQFFLVSGAFDTAAVNEPFGAPLRVRVTDSFGNPVQGAKTWWVDQGGGATFALDTVLTDADGYAENTATHGPTPVAASAITAFVVGSAESRDFFYTTTAAAATQLVVTQQPPTATTAGQAFALTVEARDQFGNRDFAYADSATIVILNGATGATLGGITKRAMLEGSVQFTGLSLDKVGSYELAISAPGLSTATTAATTVTAGAPASITLVSGDAQSGVVNTTLANPFVVEVLDAAGNPVPDAEVLWAVTSGDANVTIGSVLTDASGQSQTELVLGTLAGTVTVTATVGALPAVEFTATVLAGAPAVPVESVAPAGGTAGVALGSFSYALEDAFGNLATGYSGSAKVTLQKADAGQLDPVILSGDSVDVVNGVATWSALVIASAGQYQIVADFGGTIGSVVSGIITIDPAGPSTLLNAGGDAQSAVVLQNTVTPLRARVTDAYGNGTSGVTVNFNVISGSATLGAASVPTDIGGYAEVSVLMGTVADSVVVGAFAAGLTPDSVLYNLLALPDAPASFDILGGNAQTLSAGGSSDTVRVRLKDAYLNPIAGATVTWQTAGSLTFTSATTVTDSVGVAVNTFTVGGSLGLIDFSAQSAPASEASLTVTVVAGAADSVVVVSAPASGTAGFTLSPLVVELRDAFGNVAKLATDTVHVAVDASLTAGTLGGTLSVLPDSGVATFSDLSLTLAGPYRLVASVTGLAPDTSAQFDLVAGEATSASITGGDGQVGVVGTAIANPLEITVIDLYGNPVPDFETYWSVSAGSGAVLDTNIFRTDAQGVARATLVFGTAVTSFTVTGSALDAGQVVFSLSTTNAPAANLIMSAEPATTVAGAVIGPMAVVARDGFLNTALDFVGEVTAVIDSGPAGATLGGTTTVAAVAGTATFADLTLDRVGTYRLRLQSPGLTDTVTVPFAVTVAPVAAIAIVEGDAQTDTVGATLPTQLKVRVTDAFGNPVSGESLNWSSSPSVSFGESAIGTDSIGEMALAVTLGTLAGPYTVTVAIQALPESSVTFNLTALAGAATQLVVTSAPDTVVAGDSVSVTVEARDAYGNVATGYAGTITVQSADAPAPVGGVTSVTADAGVASFDALSLETVGAYFLIAFADVDTVGFEIRSIAASPAQLAILSGDGQSGFTGFQLDSAIVLRVSDAFDNPVVGDTVIVTRDIGTGVLGDLQDSLVIATDFDGRAFVYWTLGAEVGTQTLRARTATLGPVTISATAVQAIASAIWTGALNTSAVDGANWRNGVVPSPTDSVLIPAGAPNYPALATTTTYARLTVEDGASLNLGPYTLSVTRDVRAPLAGGIFTTNGGGVTADSAGTIVGQLPRLTVDGEYQTAGLVVVDGVVTVQNSATFTVNGGDSLHVGSSLSTLTGGALHQLSGSGMYVGSGGMTLDGGSSTFGADARLHLLGSLFTQQTAAPTAFVADSAHQLHLLPGATQSIYLFDNDVTPGGACTASCLGTVIANKSAGQGAVAFLTDAMARGGFQVSVDSIGGNSTYVVAGAPSTLLANSGGLFRRFGFTGSYSVNAFSADTLVAFGSGYLPANLVIPTIVAGQYLINAGHDAGLIVDGVLGVEGAGAAVNGSLRTRGNGYLTMTDAGDSLVVTGELRFEGSAEAGQMTAGALEALGDVYLGASAALVADSGHVLRFTDGGGHSLTVVDATTRLGSVLLTNNTGVTITGDSVRVAGDLTVLGLESQFANVGSALLEIGGRLVMPEGSGLSFTTTVLTGTDAIATPRLFDTVVLRGPNTLSDTLRVVGSLMVESGGSFVLNGRRVEVDSLFTSGTGTITMANAADTLTVFGTAIFNGGASVLTDGRLRLAGRVDGNGGAIQGAPTHTTEFFGGASQQVGFGNSGFGVSQAHFGRIELKKSGAAPFSSTAVYANGQLVTAAPNQTWQGVVPSNTLNIRGADISGLSLPDQPLVIHDGAAITSLADLQFSAFDPNVTQLSILRSGGTVNLVSPAFDAAQTPNVAYLAANDVNSADGDPLIVAVSDPSPAFHGGKISVLNGASISGWENFAALIWTGSVDTDWTNPNNWDQGVTPTAADSVVIPTTVNTPTLSVPDTVRALDWQDTGSSLSLSAPLTITEALSTPAGADFGAVACSGLGSLVFAASDSALVSGWVSCPVVISQGLTRLASGLRIPSLTVEGTGEAVTRVPASGSLSIEGNVTVRGNGVLQFGHEDFSSIIVQIDSGLTTEQNGVLRMQNVGTTVTVLGDAVFGGGSTAGQLTGGTIRFAGDFTQLATTSGASYQGEGAHESRFDLGMPNQTVAFATPGFGAEQSRMGQFNLWQVSGSTLLLASDVYYTSQLGHPFISPVTLQQSGGFRTLYGNGAAVNYVTFDGVRWELGGSVAVDPSGQSYLSFINQDPTAVQFRIARDGSDGAVNLSALSFSTTPTTGRYLVVEDTILNASPLTVTVSGASPIYYGAYALTLGEASLVGWDSEFIPEVNIYTDGSTTAWSDTANWSLGRLPTALDDVVISAGSFPTISSNAFARNLTVQSTAGIDVASVLEVRGSAEFSDFTFGTAGTIRLRPDIASVTIQQTGTTFEPAIEIVQGDAVDPLVSLASDFTTSAGGESFRVDYGRFSPGGRRLYLSSDFATTGSGVLVMTNTADSLEVGNLRFAGGSTAALLTDGGIFFSGSFVQAGGAADAFAAGPGHRTHGSLVSTDSIHFANPGADGNASRFGSFTADAFTAGQQTRFLTPAAITGNLSVVAAATVALAAGDTLDVLGSVDVDGAVSGPDRTSALRMYTPTTGATLAATGSIAVPLWLQGGYTGGEGTVTMVAPVNLDTTQINDFQGFRHGLYLRAGVLDVNGHTLHSRGGLRVGGSGILRMDGAADSVNAEWNLHFAGPDNEGYLTDGVLVANSSSFYQFDSVSTKAFVSTGNHRVVVAGGNTSIDLNFASSSPTTSRIANLAIQKSQYATNFYGVPWTSADTVYVGNLTALASETYVSQGSLVVTGSVPASPSSPVYMESTSGIVRLDGVDPATCNGISFDVQWYKGQFIPSSCHTPALTFTTETSNTVQNLNGLWVRSLSDVLAVGDAGTILVSDQSAGDGAASWSAVTSNTAEHLYAVTSVLRGADHDYYAVGANGTILRRVGGSGEFSAMTSPVGTALRAIFAIDSANVLAVGDGGRIVRFDGVSWDTVSSGTAQDLYTIGASADTIFVGGTGGTLLVSVGGGTWSTRASNTVQALRGFVSVSGFERYFVGDNGGITQMSSFSTSTYPVSPFPVAASLRGVAALGGFGLIVGSGGTVLQKQQDSWTKITGPSGANFNAVRGLSYGAGVRAALFVGDGGVIHWVILGTEPPA